MVVARGIHTMKMVESKSLDETSVELSIISTLLHDVQTLCGGLSPRELRLDLLKVKKRCSQEGMSFLTKTLPRLGKAFDRALSGEVALDSSRFRKIPGTELPKLFGELFKRVFKTTGWVLPSPCINSIKCLRQLLYLFYKYELPRDPMLDQAVISAFVEAENELSRLSLPLESDDVVVRSRYFLAEVFRDFDPTNIVPGHGPGVVSTRETAEGKYTFKRCNDRITAIFPFDAFFMASMGHVVDEWKQMISLPSIESDARVILVPKDSRGPRLISCEPLENQWIQQGLMRAIVPWIESHPLTKGKVNFTDQMPNRNAAQQASITGALATLDLKDASDRVSMALVNLIWPKHLTEVLSAIRSLGTLLPDGKRVPLLKHAPMGSAMCFPVLAMTVWALLAGSTTSKDIRKDILVYGDDVIVPQAFACTAITQLERFGLRVNHSKCCIHGLFRESCGMDAYNGVDVTPVRLKTVWWHRRDASTLVSWVSYANLLHKRGYTHSANNIAERLIKIYKYLPSDGAQVGYPSFEFDTCSEVTPKLRVNRAFQKLEKLVWVVIPNKRCRKQRGWSRLLRYFTECRRPSLSTYLPKIGEQMPSAPIREDWYEKLHTNTYTLRRCISLRCRWR